ncbi:MAG TPA: carbohydrate porin [Chthoniobacteraceae bacterium]|nr:carbohydrate porin [Chthoniobacteraceae bacterium]
MTTALAVALFSCALRAADPTVQPGDPPSGPGGWRDWRSGLEQRGVRFSLQSISEGWANLRGGERRGGAYTGLAEGELELDLEKLTGWKGATLQTRWFAPYGRDLSARRIGNHFTVSHAAARPSLYLYELWLEQRWLEGALSVRAGQLAADEAFAVSEYGSLFLNAAFGWPPFLSENLPGGGPAFPRGTLGVRIAVQPGERVRLLSALYQGDPFDEEINRHGLRWRPGGSTGYLWMNEAQFRWNYGEKSGGLPGEAKGGFWYHTPDGENAGFAPTRRRKGNAGLYGVVDQMLLRLADSPESSPRGVAWFGRFGIQPQERNTLGLYFDTGLTFHGLFAARGEDALGIGFACGRWTRGARRTLEAESGHNAAREMLVELTYHCQLTPRLALQPDVQWIIHPGATREFGNALAVGLRSTWTF